MPCPALTSTTATSGERQPKQPARLQLLALRQAHPTGSAADIRSVTGERTSIGPIARVLQSRVNAVTDATPEAAPSAGWQVAASGSCAQPVPISVVVQDAKTAEARCA